MKINISVDMPTAEASRNAKPALPPLEERVDYAICQIDCNTPEKKRAIAFLREIAHRIDALPRPTPTQMHCQKLARAAVQDYGTYYKGMKEDDDDSTKDGV